MTWQLVDDRRFNSLFGRFLLRVEDNVVRVRITPAQIHSNLSGAMHGGALLGFMDIALFAAARGFGLIEAGTAVTVDLQAQFLGGAAVGRPIEARVELLRETRRLLFMRGLVVQGEGETTDGAVDNVAAFSATIRKPTAPMPTAK